MNLFKPHELGNLILKNRIVMAPMTRSRAINNMPNDLMAHYYKQRASAGLIITEATAVSSNGLGYARMPGIYAHNQVEGWKKITQGVHQKGGSIFAQLIHTGRISHPENMGEGCEVLAPSEIPAKGEIHTDRLGPLPYPKPKAMTIEEIQQVKTEFVIAAQNAIIAGFDGVEIHGANGYLIEQFLNPNTNQRNDEYGGVIKNRCRFTIELINEVAKVIGARKVGIRLSPYSTLNDMTNYDSVNETYLYIIKEISKAKIAYIHLINYVTPEKQYETPAWLIQKIRENFNGKIILCGDIDRVSAENLIKNGLTDFAAFGKPFVANPDLVYRMKNNLKMNSVELKSLYTPDQYGYIDYPAYKTFEPTYQN